MSRDTLNTGKSPRIILGIDPGLADLGWGIIRVTGNNFEVLGFDSIKTSPKATLSLRLIHIYEQLRSIINTYRPDEVAIEELFFGKNAKTAMTVGQARGVVLILLAQMSYEPSEYKPAEIKNAVAGYGNADKRQMQLMVQKTLKLNEIPKQDDAADALAIALTHAVTNSKLKI
jgi:crossover junction endodeoxyribonuclease RuvC